MLWAIRVRVSSRGRVLGQRQLVVQGPLLLRHLPGPSRLEVVTDRLAQGVYREVGLQL